MNQLNPNEILVDRIGRFRPELFAYVANFTITAGAVAPVLTTNIQVQADSDFVWQQGTYSFQDSQAATESVTAANVEIPSMLLQIMDSANGKNMFFSPVQLNSWFSNTAQFPAIYPTARQINAAANLSFTLTSTHTFVLGYDVQLVLTGYKKIRDVG